MQINVLEYLERTALRFPQKTAFADDDGALSFSQLQARAQGLGSLLAAELAPRTPVPVLAGGPEVFQTLRRRLAEPEFSDVAAVDFTDLAQSCRTYDEWTARAAATPEEDLRYVGLALWGPKKKVDRLTGSLPLLR